MIWKYDKPTGVYEAFTKRGLRVAIVEQVYMRRELFYAVYVSKLKGAQHFEYNAKRLSAAKRYAHRRWSFVEHPESR